MQKRVTGTGLMSKTLKRRPEKSGVKTPDAEKRVTKKRKPLVLSDSSLEDARAPGAVATGADGTAVIVDQKVSGPENEIENENQLLEEPPAEAAAANANGADVDDDIDDLERDPESDDNEDEQMEVDNVDMQNLPFHSADL